MRVFGFDLPPYPECLDHLEVDGELLRVAADVLPALRRHVVSRAVAA